MHSVLSAQVKAFHMHPYASSYTKGLPHRSPSTCCCCCCTCRILQDAVPVNASEPGIIATPGAYGSAASPEPAIDNLPADPTIGSDNSTISELPLSNSTSGNASDTAVGILPSDTTDGTTGDTSTIDPTGTSDNTGEAPPTETTSGTTSDTTSTDPTTGDTTTAIPASDSTAGTTSDTPQATNSGTASGTASHTPQDTTSDTIVVNQGSTTREAATMQSQDPTSSQSKAVSGDGSSGNSSGGDQVAEQLSGNQIAGIVVGVAVAAGAAVLGAMAYQRYRRHKVDDYVSRYQRYDGIEMH